MQREQIETTIKRWCNYSSESQKYLMQRYEISHGPNYSSEEWISFLEAQHSSGECDKLAVRYHPVNA